MSPCTSNFHADSYSATGMDKHKRRAAGRRYVSRGEGVSWWVCVCSSSTFVDAIPLDVEWTFLSCEYTAAKFNQKHQHQVHSEERVQHHVTKNRQLLDHTTFHTVLHFHGHDTSRPKSLNSLSPIFQTTLDCLDVRSCWIRIDQRDCDKCTKYHIRKRCCKTTSTIVLIKSAFCWEGMADPTIHWERAASYERTAELRASLTAATSGDAMYCWRATRIGRTDGSCLR
jgi:hypothetical protein